MGGYIGEYIGDYYKVIKGDTRSLDYSSYGCFSTLGGHPLGCRYGGDDAIFGMYSEILVLRHHHVTPRHSDR